MVFRHLDLNDWLYTNNFEKAINKIKKGLNFESYSLEELLEMIEISKFFDDKNNLNNASKKIIEENLNAFKQINSTIAKYFNSITPNKIKLDLQKIRDEKGLYPFGYYNCMVKFKSYLKLNDIEFKALIDDGLFYLYIALRSKDMVNTFNSVIHSELLSNAEGITYLIRNYDMVDENKMKEVNYYFPNFSDDDIDLMINNYLHCEHKNLNYLQALNFHRNNIDSYKISRKTRVEIKKTIELEQKRIFNKKTSTSFGVRVIIDSGQKIDNPIIFKGDQPNIEISFSKDFLASDTSTLGIMKCMYFILDLVDNQWRLYSTFNPINENTLTRLFELKTEGQYGSYLYFYKLNISNLLFSTYFEFLNREGIKYTDVLNTYVKEKIGNGLLKEKFKIDLKLDNDFLSNCERLFNEIPSLLSQYQIYVEEGDIDDDLLNASSDSIKISQVPSLIKSKYVEIIPDSEIKSYFYILFSNQCMLSYIDENIYASSFVELINKYEIKTTAYINKPADMQMIDYLIKQKILFVNQNNIYEFCSPLQIQILQDLYTKGFISYHHISNEAKNIINDLKSKNLIKEYSSLFSNYESDYLSFILNNEKFSNALALRNKYEHGKGKLFSEEENKDNFIIGLKALTEIVSKIDDDIILKQHIKQKEA
ncbi:MAG: hypothetical protein SO253_04640 [Bacilli bacterium]|nr:hypothetical protein [Bacilli bacterium]